MNGSLVGLINVPPKVVTIAQLLSSSASDGTSVMASPTAIYDASAFPKIS